MLPNLLLTRLKSILGNEFESVLHAFSDERIGSFRINTLKSSKDEVFREFGQKGIEVKIFFELTDVYLFSREYEYKIKGTDAFYQGKIYLQSLASMMPAIALAPHPGESILDVCAAPGSKTTQMAMMMKNSGNILALEQNQIRFDKLMYNAKLQGATIIEGKKMDARKFLAELGLDRHASLAMTEHVFDRILLDAPCSAEGRIDTNNEKSYGFWTLENISEKSQLQYELLSGALSHLKSGGTLLYSTCTLAPEENEGIVSRILRENENLEIVPIDIGLSDQTWWKSGLSLFEGQDFAEGIEKTVRILPSELTEGFYMAKIEKK